MSQLTKETLQYLKQSLQEVITDHITVMDAIKQEENNIWTDCDPNNPSTQPMFERLNQLRDYKRYINRHLFSLTKAQTEIKRAIASGG